MLHTRFQQCFTVFEVAADWHELMIPQCIMLPPIVGTSKPFYTVLKCNRMLWNAVHKPEI